MNNELINSKKSYEVDINLASPAMQQFLRIKVKYIDTIILFRMGDFYETFFEDAQIVSKDLEITLTSRDCANLGRIYMAGVPVKAVDFYIPKLLEKGHKVAICEQLQDPKTTKGIVDRGIVKTITAGTLTDDSMLNSTSNNYLCAIIQDKNADLFGLAYADITTGEFKVTELNLNQLLNELSRIRPAEVLGPVIIQKIASFQIVPEEKVDLPIDVLKNYNVSKVPNKAFDENLVKENLELLFNIKSLEAFGFSQKKLAFKAAGAIIWYLKDTQQRNLPKFNLINYYDVCNYLTLDEMTRRNLEIFETMKDRKKQGSLLWALDKTCTNMGARLLKKWLSQPLKEKKEIINRQNAIKELSKDPNVRLRLTELLKSSYDIERLSVKIENNSANPRDFLSLKTTLSLLPNYKHILKNFKNDLLNSLEEIDDLVEFSNNIEKKIRKDALPTLKEGGIINQGVNASLDYQLNLLENGQAWLDNFEQKERERTGIKNLKIGYSKTFGYFIELTNSVSKFAPAHYIRKQTLTGGERFIVEELKNHETKVINAKSISKELEYKIFCEFREESKKYCKNIKDIAIKIAIIDVLLSLTIVSIENNYCCPEITEENTLNISQARHPVIERLLPFGEYISNDLYLDKNNVNFMILTGPNMAGKSTYMRQNALMIILSQMGAFIPAKKAEIGIVDKIFTRVGAVDDLTIGQSTFMVEMNETAYILNTATEKSFIILDEIGRGTSTYDGVAIAWSVAQYIATRIKARTIFATHYHELNVMNDVFPQIKNYRMTVLEDDSDKNNLSIKFLRKVVPGSASKSYGICVAKMAGLPKEVVEQASILMQKMQKDYSRDLSKSRKNLKSQSNKQMQLNFEI